MWHEQGRNVRYQGVTFKLELLCWSLPKCWNSSEGCNASSRVFEFEKRYDYVRAKTKSRMMLSKGKSKEDVLGMVAWNVLWNSVASKSTYLIRYKHFFHLICSKIQQYTLWNLKPFIYTVKKKCHYFLKQNNKYEKGDL